MVLVCAFTLAFDFFSALRASVKPGSGAAHQMLEAQLALATLQH
jgi:hypothetical protein